MANVQNIKGFHDTYKEKNYSIIMEYYQRK